MRYPPYPLLSTSSLMVSLHFGMSNISGEYSMYQSWLYNASGNRWTGVFFAVGYQVLRLREWGWGRPLLFIAHAKLYLCFANTVISYQPGPRVLGPCECFVKIGEDKQEQEACPVSPGLWRWTNPIALFLLFSRKTPGTWRSNYDSMKAHF